MRAYAEKSRMVRAAGKWDDSVHRQAFIAGLESRNAAVGCRPDNGTYGLRADPNAEKPGGHSCG